MTTSPKDAALRADRGTCRIAAAAFSNGMSKATTEVEIDAFLAQPLTALVAANSPASSLQRDRSEWDVLRDKDRHRLHSARRLVGGRIVTVRDGLPGRLDGYRCRAACLPVG